MNNTYLVVWGICAVLSLIFVGYRVVVHKKRGPRFPAPSEYKALYEDRWASGRSLENIITQLGGARNCLKLTVTPDELWTTTWLFPFIGDAYDLEHRIKKQDIVSVGKASGLFKGGTLVVEYRRENGSQARLELTPKRYEEFKQALEVGMNVT